MSRLAVGSIAQQRSLRRCSGNACLVNSVRHAFVMHLSIVLAVHQVSVSGEHLSLELYHITVPELRGLAIQRACTVCCQL